MTMLRATPIGAPAAALPGLAASEGCRCLSDVAPRSHAAGPSARTSCMTGCQAPQHPSPAEPSARPWAAPGARGRGRRPRLNRRSGSGRRSGGNRPSNVSQRVALETTVRPRNTRPSARRTPTARAAAPSPSVTISRTCAPRPAGGSAAARPRCSAGAARAAISACRHAPSRPSKACRAARAPAAGRPPRRLPVAVMLSLSMRYVGISLTSTRV